MIHIRVVASREDVNIYSTRRVTHLELVRCEHFDGSAEGHPQVLARGVAREDLRESREDDQST